MRIQINTKPCINYLKQLKKKQNITYDMYLTVEEEYYKFIKLMLKNKVIGEPTFRKLLNELDEVDTCIINGGVK